MNIRLEYSQAEGKFNQAQAADPVNVEEGYKTLCCFIAAERATRFTQAILSKYPEFNAGNRTPFPSFSTMKNELYEFVAEDIKVLEQHMNTAYQRRKQLFTKK